MSSGLISTTAQSVNEKEQLKKQIKTAKILCFGGAGLLLLMSMAILIYCILKSGSMTPQQGSLVILAVILAVVLVGVGLNILIWYCNYTEKKEQKLSYLEDINAPKRQDAQG